MVSFGNIKWLVQFTSANLCRGGRRGVWFHVLCGVLRTRNTFRAADSLWNKGNLCDYVDRAWLIVLFVNYLFICRLVPSQQSYSVYCFRCLLGIYMRSCCKHGAKLQQSFDMWHYMKERYKLVHFFIVIQYIFCFLNKFLTQP